MSRRLNQEEETKDNNETRSLDEDMAAEQKRDVMPLVLLGDYSIIIEKK